MNRDDFNKINQLITEGGFFGIQNTQNTPPSQGVRSAARNTDPRKQDFFKDLSSGPGSTPQVSTPTNENEEEIDDPHVVKMSEVEKTIQARIKFIEESQPELKNVVEHLRAIEKDIMSKTFNLNTIMKK